MNAKLIALAAMLARKQGAAMAKLLMQEAQAWMADPANDVAKRALVEHLRGIAEKAGGAAGRLSSRLAKEIDRRKAARIVERGTRIVDGAGADDDGEAVVGAVEDVVQRMAGGEHGARRGVGAGELADDLLGSSEFAKFLDAQVVGGFQHFVVGSSWDF